MIAILGMVAASRALAGMVETNTPVPSQDVPRSGPALYASLCAGCHGADLQGGLGSNLSNNQWRFGDDDDSIAASIRDGRVEAGMPPMGEALSEEEIRELVQFLRTHNAQPTFASHQVAEAATELAYHSERHAFRVENVTDWLDTPWSIAFLPDGAMLVTEKEGRLRIIDHTGLRPEPVTGTPGVWHIGQGGLLDVAVHPEYEDNGWIYLSYSESESADVGMLAVARGRLRDGQWSDSEVIFRAPRGTLRPGGAQFGSRLVLDRSGHLYFSIGDRDFPDDAQDLTRPNGKIHRIRDDGRIPEDNPFADRPGALPSIWSIGHRNPQGLALHPITGELWSAEHGPRGGDEINVITRGSNYGWPVITHGTHYDGTPVSERTEAEGMEQPVRHYTPSIGICAVRFYTGATFPAWRNQMLVTALVREELRRMEVIEGRIVSEETIVRGLGRVRDVTTGPDGNLYIALNLPDRIIRLVPSDPADTDFIVHATPEESWDET